MNLSFISLIWRFLLIEPKGVGEKIFLPSVSFMRVGVGLREKNDNLSRRHYRVTFSLPGKLNSLYVL